MSSYLALHRATLTVPAMSPSPRWALTPPFHPYLSRSDQMGSHRLGHRRFDFCGAGVGLLRLGVIQRPARGVRTFLSMGTHRATIQSSTHAGPVYERPQAETRRPAGYYLQWINDAQTGADYFPSTSGNSAAGTGARF